MANDNTPVCPAMVMESVNILLYGNIVLIAMGGVFVSIKYFEHIVVNVVAQCFALLVTWQLYITRVRFAELANHWHSKKHE